MRLAIRLLVLVVFAAVTHYFVLLSIPGLVMGKANSLFEAQGIPINQWVASPPQTPETQRVVRPSPDLAYAVCRFDTREGPVLISAPTWEGYGSVSIFNDQTDNVFVGSLGADSAFKGVIAHRKRNPPIGTGEGYARNGRDSVVVEGKGIALIRRLAPDPETYERAAALVEGSICERITPG